MLATALRWHIHHRSLKQLQQTLLHTLARHIACDTWVIRFASNLVDLIDKDDTFLGFLHVVIRLLQQTCEQTLHIFAYITCLSQHGGIHNGERHLQQLSNRASQEGLTRTC